MSIPVALPWSHPTEGLPLAVPTLSGWAEMALEHLDELLVDHAHCEQKAANTAIALIGRFPDHPGLARAMIALAQEEMHHFRQVLDRIEARGGTLGKPLPDTYVRELRAWAFRHRGGIGPLGDLLLASALVEARSCERFRLLAGALLERSRDEERELGTFYLRLADAEGRHWELFRDLSGEAAPAAVVKRRLAEMTEAEGAILAARPLEPRMH
jgi:tRNA-(ms[2]io[6]A)-hydroxylase